MRKIRKFFALSFTGLFVFLIWTNNSFSKDYHIGWTPNPEPVSGYIIYYGTTLEELRSMNYYKDVGKVSSAKITGFEDDTFYLFAVTAYDDYDESDLSSILIALTNYSQPVDVSADYDGDGKLEEAYRINEGYWVIKHPREADSGSWNEIIPVYPGSDFIPYPIDHDKDGKMDIAQEHVDTGECYFSLASSNYTSWSTLSNYQCSGGHLPQDLLRIISIKII